MINCIYNCSPDPLAYSQPKNNECNRPNVSPQKQRFLAKRIRLVAPGLAAKYIFQLEDDGQDAGCVEVDVNK